MRVNPYAVPLPSGAAGVEEKKKSVEKAGFENLLQGALQDVNSQQVEAARVTEGLISGEVEDLHQVMLASEKARLSLQLTVQVTNKVIEAYRDISRMQI